MKQFKLKFEEKRYFARNKCIYKQIKDKMFLWDKINKIYNECYGTFDEWMEELDIVDPSLGERWVLREVTAEEAEAILNETT